MAAETVAHHAAAQMAVQMIDKVVSARRNQAAPGTLAEHLALQIGATTRDKIATRRARRRMDHRVMGTNLGPHVRDHRTLDLGLGRTQGNHRHLIRHLIRKVVSRADTKAAHRVDTKAINKLARMLARVLRRTAIQTTETGLAFVRDLDPDHIRAHGPARDQAPTTGPTTGRALGLVQAPSSARVPTNDRHHRRSISTSSLKTSTWSPSTRNQTFPSVRPSGPHPAR
jgi:hypothetical protein